MLRCVRNWVTKVGRGVQESAMHSLCCFGASGMGGNWGDACAFHAPTRSCSKPGNGLCLRHVSRFCMLAHSHVHAGKPGQRQLRMQVDHRCTHAQVRPARTVSALQHVHAGLGRVIGQRQCPCRHDGAAQAESRRRLQRVAGPPRRRRADNAPGGRQRRGGHRRPGTRPRAGQ